MLQVKATYPDGTHVEGVAVKVTTSINNNKEVLFDDEMITDKSGIAEATVLVPREANCLQIRVSCKNVQSYINLHDYHRLKEQQNLQIPVKK